VQGHEDLIGALVTAIFSEAILAPIIALGVILFETSFYKKSLNNTSLFVAESSEERLFEACKFYSQTYRLSDVHPANLVLKDKRTTSEGEYHQFDVTAYLKEILEPDENIDHWASKHLRVSLWDIAFGAVSGLVALYCVATATLVLASGHSLSPPIEPQSAALLSLDNVLRGGLTSLEHFFGVKEIASGPQGIFIKAFVMVVRFLSATIIFGFLFAAGQRFLSKRSLLAKFQRGQLSLDKALACYAVKLLALQRIDGLKRGDFGRVVNISEFDLPEIRRRVEDIIIQES